MRKGQAAQVYTLSLRSPGLLGDDEESLVSISRVHLAQIWAEEPSSSSRTMPHNRQVKGKSDGGRAGPSDTPPLLTLLPPPHVVSSRGGGWWPGAGLEAGMGGGDAPFKPSKADR